MKGLVGADVSDRPSELLILATFVLCRPGPETRNFASTLYMYIWVDGYVCISISTHDICVCVSIIIYVLTYIYIYVIS